MTDAEGELRFDALTRQWVNVVAHRQTRPNLPESGCPFCVGGLEAPNPYDVRVFENRWPAYSPGDAVALDPDAGALPAVGACEVVLFSPEHDASLSTLPHAQVRKVIDVWAERTDALLARPEVEYVLVFENRGREVGATIDHPHGQIYGYPFTTPRTALMLRSLAAHKEATGGENLFDDVVARELAEGDRIVLETERWVAFVPYAAHWPYEVHLYPKRRVPDLLGLDEETRTEFPQVYLELLRRFDRIFGEGEPPTPYIAAWHQAPFGALEEFEGVSRDDFALHLELFTIRRTSGKLKFLAGSESGMSVFINDVPPEAAAQRLREVASS